MNLIHVEIFDITALERRVEKSIGFVFINLDQISYCEEITYLINESNTDEPKKFLGLHLILRNRQFFIVRYSDLEETLRLDKIKALKTL